MEKEQAVIEAAKVIDFGFILDSLNYTRRTFERYDYPNNAIRRERLDDLCRVVTQVRALRDAVNEHRKANE